MPTATLEIQDAQTVVVETRPEAFEEAYFAFAYHDGKTLRAFYYETIEIPAPPTPEPPPTLWYESLEVKTHPEAPYFNCTIVEPNTLAVDFIQHVPVQVRPTGWIEPKFSILITEKEIVDVWGSTMLVKAYEGSPARLMGSIQIIAATGRMRTVGSVGVVSRWTWVKISRNSFFL